MKNCFKYKILSVTLLLIAIAVSCADIETETSGYLSLEVHLDDISNRKTGRSKFAESMTSSEAKTILAVLIPAVQCEASSASTNTEYSRALVDVNTHAAQFLVPLETQVKLCLYFYRETFSLDELISGNTLTGGLGESDIFSIDSETTSKTVSVEYWTTKYSTVSFKISSTSSAGMMEGVTGSVKLNSGSGQMMDNQSFTIN